MNRKRPDSSRNNGAKPGGVSLNRVFSKLGVASRSQADAFIRAGRVAVDGVVVRNPEQRVLLDTARVTLDGQKLAARKPVYLMLNKPRGLVTTLHDPQGRDTVYRCLEGLDLPHVSPVGRLDKASEGLLLMTNDTAFSQRILDPETGPDKLYHVQVDRVPDAALLARIKAGTLDDGERLAASDIDLLRSGSRNAWLAITLDEGRNRHIRRLLSAFDIGVLRLIRVAIGGLQLGDLPKGQIRELTVDELALLAESPPHPISSAAADHAN